MIEIFSYSKNYLPGIVDLIIPIQQEEFGIQIKLKDQPDLLDIPNFYQKTGGNFWVALNDSEVIGTISLLNIGNGQGALRKMFVKKQFRGIKNQVAEKLLRVLFNWCKANHVEEVFLGTTSKFLAAHRFYEKNGFSEILKTDLPLSFPVMGVDTKFYSQIVSRATA